MEAWEKMFPPQILERGRNYFNADRVSHLERTEDGYTATVKGEERYEVEILLDGDSVEDMSCDCPYAEDGSYCKHMAAVLFAVASGTLFPKSAAPAKSAVTPASLVEKIPDERLRPLLAELISADERLYLRLLHQYGDTTLDECVRTFKKELAAIEDLYVDRHGYVAYGDAADFEDDMAELIRRQTETLLGRGEPMLALQMGLHAYNEYADSETDEYCGGLDDVMDEMLTNVLDAVGEEDASEVFGVLLSCVKSDSQMWQVRDFAEKAIFSRFSGEAFDRKRLELVDEQIAAVEAKDSLQYSDEYTMERLLARRFDLMRKLSRPKEELDGFLARYKSYSAVRKLSVQRCLDAGQTEDAIRLLEEGKAADRNKFGLVQGYSRQLMDLYERQGQRDKLLAELKYHIFDLSAGGMEMLERLKRTCTPEQWTVYREKYLSKQGCCGLELMKAEGLWERLMEAVAGNGQISTLDRYEDVLKQRYPDEMREAYVRILEKQAELASDRKGYQELAKNLKKVRKYPSGSERAAQLAASWRTKYSRRRAMMEELRNAGF